MYHNLRWGLAALLAGALAVPGAAAPAAKPKPPSKLPPKTTPVKPVPAEKPSPKPADDAAKSDADLPNPADYPPVEALTPVESGPGLAVCQPVLTAGGTEAGDLGDGCARWLQLTA